MKITKFGHCCLLIEEAGLRILTDPGIFTTEQNNLTGIDIVLITHEHADHFHVDSLKAILKNNPKATVVTNGSVGKLIQKETIAFSIINDGKKWTGQIEIEGFGTRHADIYKTITPVENTGYFIANKLFYPGDAFVNLPKGRMVEILALPVAGPWMKISEAIEYALALRPKISFAVHDGILARPEMMARIPASILAKEGLTLTILDLAKEYQF